MSHYVIGKHAVTHLLQARPSAVKAVYLSTLGGELESLARTAQISVEKRDSAQLSKLVQTDSHQGVVAEASKKAATPLKDFLSADMERATVVALDGVTDPQNTGSIMRAAECFGVDAVMWSTNRGPGLTPVVTKASVGATELINRIEVSNLADALKKLKKQNFWVVVGDGSLEAEELKGFSFPEKCIFVFGAEGRGVSDIVAKQADYLVKISMHGEIDSLNVSQAVATFLYAKDAQSR